MAKDPAVLLYTSDFLVGTSMMADDEIGRYIRLLCLQHQRGRFTKEQFFKIARESDVELVAKFDIDESGMYYNVRMDNETDKRRKYSESRRNNRIKKTPITYDKHMTTHMEDENEDVNIVKNEKKKKHKYGEYKNVLLTDEEVGKLRETLGATHHADMILELDEGIEQHGYKYKSHYLAILKWHKKNSTQSTHSTRYDYVKLPSCRNKCTVCGKQRDLRYGKCEECTGEA